MILLLCACGYRLKDTYVCNFPKQILTSVSWLGNGKVFGSSYSDGSIAIWNPRSDSRPEKVFFPHGELSWQEYPCSEGIV